MKLLPLLTFSSLSLICSSSVGTDVRKLVFDGVDPSRLVLSDLEQGVSCPTLGSRLHIDLCGNSISLFPLFLLFLSPLRNISSRTYRTISSKTRINRRGRFHTWSVISSMKHSSRRRPLLLRRSRGILTRKGQHQHPYHQRGNQP